MVTIGRGWSVFSHDNSKDGGTAVDSIQFRLYYTDE